MMYGLREEFIYFQCSVCGCLQISELPKDIKKYYPADIYYSYHQQIKASKLRGSVHKLLFWGYRLKLLPATFRYLRAFPALPSISKIKKTASILGIGCGNGMLIKEMCKWGWKNLTGIDPYIIEKDIVYHSGLRVLKQDVFEHSGQYDFIMMHHSLEHMEYQHETLQKCHELLHQNGRLLIRVPVADSYFFRKFGVNWYQIDAPRHFFLHTKRSLSLLAESTGFILENIEYDGTPSDFVNSEKYCRNITLHESIEIPAKRKRVLIKQSRLLNLLHDGGAACFLFSKKLEK